MKKRNIWKWIISLVAILIIAIPLAIEVHMKNEHDEMIEIATSEKANKAYDETIKNMDKKAFTNESKIKNYTIDKKSIETTPMGYIDVYIYINSDKKLNMECMINSTDNGKTIEVSSNSNSEELEKIIREE